MSLFSLVCRHLRCYVAAALLAPASLGLAQGTGYWHTSGARILDATNRDIRIAGVNWYGFETVTETPGGLYAQDYKTILQTIKAQGFNTVRIPLSSQMMEVPATHLNLAYNNTAGPINGDLRGLNSLQALDKIVAAAGSIGLKVILDHHRSEAGNSAEASGLWYTGGYPESAWIADWVALAYRYFGNSTVIGFDLHNEPHAVGSGGACWDCGGPNDWHLAAERAGNAVLGANPNLLLFVEGVDAYRGDYYWWGGNLEGVAHSPVILSSPNHLVYSAHDYGPREDLQAWFNGTTSYSSLSSVWNTHWGFVSQNNIAPVWVGEFGTTNNASDLSGNAPGSQGQWFQSLIRYLQEDADLSWSYWALNGEDGYALLDSNYDPLPASPAKQSMLASIEAPVATPVPAPAAPAGLTAIPVSTNTINLAWLPVAGTGITYNVYFGTSSAGVSTLLASGLTSTSYPAANLNCCTLYFFTVKAVSQGIASAASNPVSATTRTPPPPAAPAGLVAVASSSTEITLSWIASTTAGVTYSVFSGTSAGLITNVVAAGLTSAGLSVGGLVPATTYFFQVKANQQTVSSPASNPASATTPRLQAAPCHVTYSKPGDWGNGFLGAIAITNTGSTAIRSWTLTWSWTGNQQVTQSWNGAYTQSGRAVSLSNESWNGSIAPGATITGIGFQGTYTGTNAAPATVYLNGNACH